LKRCKKTALDDTSHLYTEKYFQGGLCHSNYSDYVRDALGPSNILAETLHRFFTPTSALDVGCAVGFVVKRLRELGVSAWGCDISDWAVSTAEVPYVRQMDVSILPIQGQFDLVYCYDVVEHVPESRLDFMLSNLWQASNKHLLVVPATYAEGVTEDPNEPTHLIFHDRDWWLQLINNATDGAYNPEITEKFAVEEHSKIFSYSDRIMIFSR
jgi:SAM-dependent methyltransferase